MASPLRDWLDKPSADRGLYMATDAGWNYCPYLTLATNARRVAGALIEDGIRPGDVVCAVMPTNLACVETYFGAWAAGATMCMIAPPIFLDGDDYVAHVAAILRRAMPDLTIAPASLFGLVIRAMKAAGLPGRPWQPRYAAEAVAEAGEDALMQFTSGSTSVPRGIKVTWRNLEANTEIICRLTGFADDGLVSWLPLYHDMGLVGCFLAPITQQMDLWMMTPSQFMRDPSRWIQCLQRAAHTAAPPFAYGYAARRVDPARLAGLDLSRCRSALVAAEPIDPHSLECFAELTEPHGFSRDAIKPAFGLAEATLLTCADTTSRPPLCVRPDPSSFRFGEPVVIAEQRRLGPSLLGAKTGWLVGCGEPEIDAPIWITDSDGRVLPSGHLGEIVVGGASVCPGYHADSGGHGTRFRDGKVFTGDAGFLHEGQLFVLGRMGDSLKVRGRSVYVEDLDARVAEIARLSKGRVVVVSVPGADVQRVAVFAETDTAPWADEARAVLNRRLGQNVEVVIVTGQGLIHRTSSGKPRRRHMYELLLSGKYLGATVD